MIKIKVLKPIKLSKSLKFGKIKEPILLEPSDEVLEVSAKWEEKLTNFPEYIEIIKDEESAE